MLLQRVGAKAFNRLLDQLGMNPPSEMLELYDGVFPMIALPNVHPVGAGDTQDAGAVNIAHAQLFNPADTNVILEVLWAVITLSIDGSVAIGRADTELTTGAAREWTDRRVPGAPQGLVKHQDVAAQGNIAEFSGALANVPYHSLMAPHVWIEPGQGLGVRTAVTAVAIDVSFGWREIPLIRT